MFMLVAAAALIALVASVVYLVEFARASRRDVFFGPAAGAGARRARRVTGMYARYVPEDDSPEGEKRELVPN